jgi:hypothetical protein
LFLLFGLLPFLKIIISTAFLIIILDLGATFSAASLEVKLTEIVPQAEPDGAEGNAEIGALVEVFASISEGKLFRSLNGSMARKPRLNRLLNSLRRPMP